MPRGSGLTLFASPSDSGGAAYFLVTTTTIATRLARICATDPAIAV
jgi:hypothetical protein